VIACLLNAVNYGEEIAIEEPFWSVYNQRKASELLFVYYLQAIHILRRKHSSFCILPLSASWEGRYLITTCKHSPQNPVTARSPVSKRCPP
jgi:hypothetical protein